MRWTVAFPMFPVDHLLPMARAAEEAGFDTITVPDSIFYPETVSADYPYSADGGRFWAPETSFPDPFVSISAMVAVTERIRFLTNVVKLAIREPLSVARLWSSDEPPHAYRRLDRARRARTGCPVARRDAVRLRVA